MIPHPVLLLPILLARSLALLAALVLFGLAAAPARAQNCTATTTAMAFGAIATSNNSTHDTTATVTLSCTGAQNQVIYYCPYLGGGTNPDASGPRYMNLNANRMKFDAFQNAARSTRYANGVSVGSSQGYAFRLNGSSGSTSLTVYGRIPAGQQALVPGAYSAALSAGSQIAYAGGHDVNATVKCADVGTNKLTPVFTMNVSATNQASCTLGSSEMKFGSVATLGTALNGLSGVFVTCSNGAPFTIGMNGGANGGTSGTNRRMASGANRITYGLYRDAGRSQPWFTDANGRLSGTGTGVNQNFPVYGRVPVQATPAPGGYADTVVVTITY